MIFVTATGAMGIKSILGKDTLKKQNLKDEALGLSRISHSHARSRQDLNGSIVSKPLPHQLLETAVSGRCPLGRHVCLRHAGMDRGAGSEKREPCLQFPLAVARIYSSPRANIANSLAAALKLAHNCFRHLHLHASVN